MDFTFSSHPMVLWQDSKHKITEVGSKRRRSRRPRYMYVKVNLDWRAVINGLRPNQTNMPHDVHMGCTLWIKEWTMCISKCF